MSCSLIAIDFEKVKEAIDKHALPGAILLAEMRKRFDAYVVINVRFGICYEVE